jgi:DNA-directed RNA polymerase specialized sigma24 family protein
MVRTRFDSVEFIAQLAQGGAAADRAGRALIRSCKPVLRGRFFVAGVAAQDVDDLVSDVLTSVLTNIHQLRDPERFEAWLYAIATNVLNRHWEGLGRTRQMFQAPSAALDEGADGGGADEAIAWPDFADPAHSDPETLRCLKAQLERFQAEHPHRFSCIELLAMGYENDEMAEQLGRSPGATRQFVSQCCAVVMRFLEPCLEAAQLLGRRRGGAQPE